jgi:hypothetical protein
MIEQFKPRNIDSFDPMTQELYRDELLQQTPQKSTPDSPNETKVKEKQNKTISDSNSNLTKSMTHHNQTKELITWFLSYTSWRGVGTLK